VHCKPAFQFPLGNVAMESSLKPAGSGARCQHLREESIGCQNIGHRPPKVMAAIEKKLTQHTCFQISPYQSYIELTERINQMAKDLCEWNLPDHVLYKDRIMLCKHPQQ
jgi:hypothetical protein